MNTGTAEQPMHTGQEREIPSSPEVLSTRGPRRLNEIHLDKRETFDIGEGDLGSQILRSGDILPPAPAIWKEGGDRERQREKRLISVRKKRNAQSGPSSELLTALTALLSPRLDGQNEGPYLERREPLALTGLGISAPSLPTRPDLDARSGVKVLK